MDLYWVHPPFTGRLAVSPRPRGGDWLGDDVRAWKRAGIDTAVSLLTPDEAEELALGAEAAACRAEGVDFVSLPVPDRGLPADPAAFAELAGRLADSLAAGGTVLVHCRQGIGRAGMLAVAILVSAGLDAEAAIQQVSTARGRPVPETPDQLRWLLRISRTRPEQPASNPA